MGRIFYIALGWVAVGVGLIGVVVPVLPTTPFLLVAAFAFGRGSPEARVWLIEHAHFGPAIRNWEDNRAISRRAKGLALSMMALVFVASVILGARPLILLIQALCLGGAGLFILTRPDGHGG